LIVREEGTDIDVQTGEDPFGVVPLVVQRVVDAAVVLLQVTVWGEVYVPLAGVQVGVAAVGILIV
jgi:hypothetical protein